jgi:hypothetical protein
MVITKGQNLDLISGVKMFVKMKWKWVGSGSAGDVCEKF